MEQKAMDTGVSGELFPLHVDVYEALYESRQDAGTPVERRLEDLEPVGCGLCLDSRFVFLGIATDDGDETTEAVPCRRCGKGE